MSTRNSRKVVSLVSYSDFGEKTKNHVFSFFLFFQKNNNKSLQKSLFFNFGLTHTDVFFDEESEYDVIFDVKLAPKG